MPANELCTPCMPNEPTDLNAPITSSHSTLDERNANAIEINDQINDDTIETNRFTLNRMGETESTAVADAATVNKQPTITTDNGNNYTRRNESISAKKSVTDL